MEFGVAQPSDDEPVVIVAEGDGGLMALTDDEHDDEAAVYMPGDPEVAELVETATRAYGPSARAMPVSEFRKLTGDSA
jgi:hypothetical protein